MKRDLNLIRALMLAVESNESPGGENGIQELTAEFTKFAVAYNLHLILEDEWISTLSIAGEPSTVLTMKGHDILDRIRDDEAWASIQYMIGNCSFEMILEALDQWRVVKEREKASAENYAWRKEILGVMTSDPLQVQSLTDPEEDPEFNGYKKVVFPPKEEQWEQGNSLFDGLSWLECKDQNYTYKKSYTYETSEIPSKEYPEKAGYESALKSLIGSRKILSIKEFNELPEDSKIKVLEEDGFFQSIECLRKSLNLRLNARSISLNDYGREIFKLEVILKDRIRSKLAENS